jgi:putative restriction endonuclease
MPSTLSYYLNKLTTLKRASLKGSKAPHKPILLLSVLQSMDAGEITTNQIAITPQLVARFKDNWNWLVGSSHFKPNFALPFFHLQGDGFWHLQTYPGQEILLTSSLSIRSFAQLKEAVAFAYLDSDLYELLTNNSTKADIYNHLLLHYFGNIQQQYPPQNLFETITKQVLNEAPVSYGNTILDEEEQFVRSGVFKKTIPQVYNYTCSITGMQIVSGYDIQMVDACHIVPFSATQNDSITNGISLSPTMHRAFDRGLIAIGDNYEILVSNSFTENKFSNIKAYQNQTIILPKHTNYYPSLDNIAWHRLHIFKQ